MSKKNYTGPRKCMVVLHPEHEAILDEWAVNRGASRSEAVRIMIEVANALAKGRLKEWYEEQEAKSVRAMPQGWKGREAT